MTVQQWFETLEPTTAKAAITNTDIVLLDTLEPNMYNALVNAFTWADTPEGFEFWSNIASKYIDVD